MRILLIAYYYPPINSGGTMRPFKMAKYLPRMGHQVTVLTHTYQKDTHEQGNPGVWRFKDISFNRQRQGWRRLVWFGLRARTEILNQLGIYSSIYSCWKKRVLCSHAEIIRRVQPDVILATYPPVETLEIGLFLSQTYHIPLIVDFRDGLLFEPIESHRLSRYQCLRRRYQEIEAAALQNAEWVTTIAAPIADYFRETYGTDRVEVLANAFDTEDLEDLPAVLPFERLCFHIVFTGRFGLSDIGTRVDGFFDAVRQVLQKQPEIGAKIRIHLLGQYREQELLVLTDLFEAGVVVYHGFVDRRHALAIQRQADLLLIITSTERKSLVTAKVFEYLFAGRPILALTHQTVLADMIRETGSGWVVHPRHSEEIAALLTRLICEPTFYHSLHPNPQAIAAYSMHKQMEKMTALLGKIKSKKEENNTCLS